MAVDSEIFFKFLRFSLGVAGEFSEVLSDKQWVKVYKEFVKQRLVGIGFCGVQKLPAEKRPARELVLRWGMEAESIRGLNRRVNEEAAEVTAMFEEGGLKSLLLKGQANALLYPDPFSRQPGDIDILLPGGKASVIDSLKKMDLYGDSHSVSTKHVEVKDGVFQTEVEVHFQPTNAFSPFKNRNILKFLQKESENATRSDLGFYVPSIRYALVMQLSHIKQHFFSTGVGLRQLVDYHQLLQNSSEEDRACVAAVLKSVGLFHMAEAVMYLLAQVFELPESKMICKPHARRGGQLMHVVMTGGNFGWYAETEKPPVLIRWVKDRVRAIKLLPFDFFESLWHEVSYSKQTLSLMPTRIKRRRLALGRR